MLQRTELDPPIPSAPQRPSTESIDDVEKCEGEALLSLTMMQHRLLVGIIKDNRSEVDYGSLLMVFEKCKTDKTFWPEFQNRFAEINQIIFSMFQNSLSKLSLDIKQQEIFYERVHQNFNICLEKIKAITAAENPFEMSDAILRDYNIAIEEIFNTFIGKGKQKEKQAENNAVANNLHLELRILKFKIFISLLNGYYEMARKFLIVSKLNDHEPAGDLFKIDIKIENLIGFLSIHEDKNKLDNEKIELFLKKYTKIAMAILDVFQMIVTQAALSLEAKEVFWKTIEDGFLDLNKRIGAVHAIADLDEIKEMIQQQRQDFYRSYAGCASVLFAHKQKREKSEANNKSANKGCCLLM